MQQARCPLQSPRRGRWPRRGRIRTLARDCRPARLRRDGRCRDVTLAGESLSRPHSHHARKHDPRLRGRPAIEPCGPVHAQVERGAVRCLVEARPSAGDEAPHDVDETADDPGGASGQPQVRQLKIQSQAAKRIQVRPFCRMHGCAEKVPGREPAHVRHRRVAPLGGLKSSLCGGCGGRTLGRSCLPGRTRLARGWRGAQTAASGPPLLGVPLGQDGGVRAQRARGEGAAQGGGHGDAARDPLG
mmetsp:Transcript_22788/g.86327  ORF Transcript_22788/g.86327 Transcript_22788/m.86327 type:complete len:244 (-) Transcript_22788:577-1308(-)